MQNQKKQNFLKSAAILAAATVFVKIVGAIYKIPLFQDSVLGDEGIGIFHSTYNVYTLLLAIATAGLPAALSRLVSSAAARGNMRLVRRYFSVALPAFLVIGVIVMLAMFFFADAIARFMNNSLTAPGIRVLAPAVLFACIISVYRGYAQGFENMIPTAASQVVEVLCKAAFGIAAALWLVSLGREPRIVSAGAIMGVTVGMGLCVPLLVWYKRKLDRDIQIDIKSEDEELPGMIRTLGRLMKVSIPITIGASFMSIMSLIDNSVVLGRLQSALGHSESEALALWGILGKGLTVYNFPPALIVPVAISIIPAIAAAIAREQRGDASGIMQSSVKLTNLLAMPAAAGIIALAGPIMIALYGDSRQLTTDIMIVFGAASFFVCFQHVTTAILQATGHERIALMTFPIGAAIKILLVYFLAGNPGFGVIGSPIGTLACFITISLLNVLFIILKVKEKLKLVGVFLKPLLCTAIMSVTAYLAYALIYRLGNAVFGTSRIAVIIFLGASIVIAVAVYAVLIIVTRTITIDDMKLVPKGEKLAKILRIK